jgi:hypothetical protein
MLQMLLQGDELGLPSDETPCAHDRGVVEETLLNYTFGWTICYRSLGNGLLLAMAGEQDRVATSDSHVLAVTGEERIGWIALPDSRGRAGHYHRATRPLSLADAVLIASARPGDRIATADPHVLAVAREEQIEPLEPPEQG